VTFTTAEPPVSHSGGRRSLIAAFILAAGTVIVLAEGAGPTTGVPVLLVDRRARRSPARISSTVSMLDEVMIEQIPLDLLDDPEQHERKTASDRPPRLDPENDESPGAVVLTRAFVSRAERI
jgi:hypothetical protein